MTRKHSPQGIQVVMTAFALFLGVALLAPTTEAMSSQDGDGNVYSIGGGNRSGGGGTPNPGPDPGGEADPDWWQTDTWSGHQIGEAPAPTPRSPRVLVIRPYPVPALGPFGGIVTWFMNWTFHVLSLGR